MAPETLAAVTAPTILTVCTGNICRSPLMERLLQAHLDNHWGVGAVSVRSAGTHGLDGAPMEPHSLAELEKLGGTGHGFASRILTPEHVAAADLIITATREHRSEAARRHPSALRKAFTVRDLADLAQHLPAEKLPSHGTPAHEWISQVVATLAARRGLRPPLTPPASDIADPYGGPAAGYVRMADEVTSALGPLLWAFTGRGGDR